MKKYFNNPILQHRLILFFSLALLLAQTNRLHIHIEHDNHSDTSVHIVNVHTTSILHDFDLIHHDDDHHPEIDVSPDNLIKKINLLNPLVLILLFTGLLLIMPRLVCMYRQRIYSERFTPCYYLCQPPLRAPPVK